MHSLVQYKTHPLNLGNFLEALNSKPDFMLSCPFSPLILGEFSLTLAALVICFQTKNHNSISWASCCHVGLPQGSIWVFPKIMVPPNHPILIGFSLINHPFWGTTIFGNIHIYMPSLFFWGVVFGELSSDKLISVYLSIHFAVVRFFLYFSC